MCSVFCYLCSEYVGQPQADPKRVSRARNPPPKGGPYDRQAIMPTTDRADR